MNIKPLLILTGLVVSSLVLAGCQTQPSTVIPTESVQPDPYMIPNDSTEPAEPNDNISKSTDLDTIDAEINQTVILDEDFSDL